MIKRDGVVLMNERTGNVAIAKETIAITKQGQYTTPSGALLDIQADIGRAIDGTILYQSYLDLPNTNWKTVEPTIEVVNETTAQAVVRLIKAGRQNVIALNFASARNQGGGFLSGALAQEEDLCRASALYACLKKKPVFYNENILCDNAFYTHNVIYSPNVPFFRGADNLLLEEPFILSIVSAPAPNAGAISKDTENLEEVLYSTLLVRATKVLMTAAAHGHKNIILGAWGCGAFGNDPQMVADVFKEALKEVPAFEHVCFAVYDTRETPILFETFKKSFLVQSGTFTS